MWPLVSASRAGLRAGAAALIPASTVAGVPTAPVAALSLIAGFAVAQATGVRPLGGIVLALALGWCVLRWRRTAGTATAVALAALYLACFAASHVIAGALGTWGAVLLVAAVAAGAAWLAADRRAALSSSPA
jgi:Fe2+ transport system protein B